MLPGSIHYMKSVNVYLMKYVTETKLFSFQIQVLLQVGYWNASAKTPEERLTFLELNDTDVKETRGIFREVETVVVVMVNQFTALPAKNDSGVMFCLQSC